VRDFRIKKNESNRPWVTPRNINADRASICVVVFINQI